MHHVSRHVVAVKPRENRVNDFGGLLEQHARRSVQFAHTGREAHLFQQLVAQVARKVHPQRKQRTEHRAAKAAEQKCHRNHHRHLAENQVDRRKQAKRRGRTREEQHHVVDGRQKHQVNRHHRKQAKVLAHNERGATNGLRQKRKHRTALDFLLHQANAHENRNQQARKAHHRKRRGLDHVGAVKHRPFAKHNTEQGERNRQKADVIENLVANGFAERIEGNDANMLKRLHGQSPPSKYLRDSGACGPCARQQFLFPGSNAAGGRGRHRRRKRIPADGQRG